MGRLIHDVFGVLITAPPLIAFSVSRSVAVVKFDTANQLPALIADQ